MGLTQQKQDTLVMQTVAKQTGVALILVLMLTGVLSAVVIFQQYRLKHRLQQAEQISAYIDAQLNAITAREQILYTLSTSGLWFYGSQAEVIAQAGMPVDFNFHGSKFTLDQVQIRITDGSGMISLLPFERDSWSMLFQFAGAAEPHRLTDELADWIDTDDFIHLNGAERFEYKQDGLPRNDIPQSIDEIAMLRSMTPEIWQRLRKHIIYIGSGATNPVFLPSTMLPVLLGSERAKSILAERQSDTQSNNNMSYGAETGADAYPSRNLYIEIDSSNDNAAYKESFLLIRGVGTTEFSYITAYRPGYGDIEL